MKSNKLKKISQILCIGVILTTVSECSVQASPSTGWVKKNNDWYYAFQNETINNGKTFYEGEICTGWLKLNGKWHFFEDINENTLGVM